MKFQKSLAYLSLVVMIPHSYANSESSPIEHPHSTVSQQDFLQQAIAQDQQLSNSEFNTTQSEQLNSLGYRSISSNSSFEELRILGESDSPTNFYDSPYRISLFDPQNGEDSERLWSQTKSIFAYGVGVAGVLALMPESITNWEKVISN